MPKQNRRQFASRAGLSLGSLAMAPLLHQIQVHADGREEALPRRFVFVIKSSGLTAEAIRPDNIDGDQSRTIDESIADHKLPATLEFLTPFRDQLLILDGLS